MASPDTVAGAQLAITKVRRELADLSLDLYNTGVDPMSNLRN